MLDRSDKLKNAMFIYLHIQYLFIRFYDHVFVLISFCGKQGYQFRRQHISRCVVLFFLPHPLSEESGKPWSVEAVLEDGCFKIVPKPECKRGMLRNLPKAIPERSLKLCAMSFTVPKSGYSSSFWQLCSKISSTAKNYSQNNVYRDLQRLQEFHK